MIFVWHQFVITGPMSPRQWVCGELVEELGLSEWDNSYNEFPRQSNRNEPGLYKKVC